MKKGNTILIAKGAICNDEIKAKIIRVSSYSITVVVSEDAGPYQKGSQICIDKHQITNKHQMI